MVHALRLSGFLRWRGAAPDGARGGSGRPWGTLRDPPLAGRDRQDGGYCGVIRSTMSGCSSSQAATASSSCPWPRFLISASREPSSSSLMWKFLIHSVSWGYCSGNFLLAMVWMVLLSPQARFGSASLVSS